MGASSTAAIPESTSLASRILEGGSDALVGAGRMRHEVASPNDRWDSLFHDLDKHDDGLLGQAEIISRLNESRKKGNFAFLSRVHSVLGIPTEVHEGKSRDEFARIFHDMDQDNSKKVSLAGKRDPFLPLLSHSPSPTPLPLPLLLHVCFSSSRMFTRTPLRSVPCISPEFRAYMSKRMEEGLIPGNSSTGAAYSSTSHPSAPLALEANPVPGAQSEATARFASSTWDDVFFDLDMDNNGLVSQRDIIIRIKRAIEKENFYFLDRLHSILGLPYNVNEGKSRDSFERVFHEMDQNGDKEISLEGR